MAISIKKNYIYNLVFQLLQIILPIITVPYLSRILGADGIGIQSFTCSIQNYFILFSYLGIALYGQREIASIRDNIKQRSIVFSELFIIKTISVIICLCLYFLFCNLFLIEYQKFFIILSIEIFAVIFDISWFYQGLEDFKFITVRNIIFKIIPIVLIFIFVKSKNDLYKFIFISVVCTFIGNICLFPGLKNKLTKINLSDINLKRHIKSILIIFLPQIAIQVYTVLDKTMIGFLTNNIFENGFYEQSVKIIKMILTIITSLGTVIIPRISFLNKNKNTVEINLILSKVFSFVFLLAFPMIFGIISISDFLVPIFLGQDFIKSIPIINVLSLLFLAIGLNNVIGMQYLIPCHREKTFTITVCIGALINFLLNFFLIPKYKALGAAIASVIAESSITIIQFIITRKIFNFKKILISNIKYIFSSCIMFILIKIIKKYFYINILSLLVLILIGIIIYCLCLLILKDYFFINLAKKIFIKKYSFSINYYYNRFKYNHTGLKRFLIMIKLLITNKFFDCNDITSLLKKTKIVKENNIFYYTIDKKCLPILSNVPLSNFTPDYKKILDIDLQTSKKLFSNYIKKLHKKNIHHLDSLIEGPATNFKDALQRILFLNQLFWQSGHTLIGLGNLENLLFSYYNNDIKNNIITEDYAIKLIEEFLLQLHKDYNFKSSLMNGDTGQVIVLSGNTKLTEYFLSSLSKLKLPDPKIVLRVNKNTSYCIYAKALKCIQSGIGSPIFCNDDVIINSMIQYGYDKNDCNNYGVSACWEPLIPGKSCDLNNFATLNFLEPLTQIDYQYKKYEDVIDIYLKKIKLNIDEIIKDIENFTFEKTAIFELFHNKKYYNFGITSCGFINTIHSLYNIKNNCINSKDISYNNEDFISIANFIFTEISNMLYSSKVGKIKLGTSSPSYIDYSKKCPKTPDGRKDFEKFHIHISKDNAKDYSQLFMFASKLNYKENRFNGNITDIVIDSNSLNKNFDKFVDIISTAIKIGVFQIQINILDSKKLIAAKNNPKLYPDLIVRVWGFSSYFNDLPDEYKDFVIQRALEHENSN